jgi:glycosyltransferase involved in cell wall biosynthesis
MRVLHVAPYLWSGAGRVITRLVESQRQRHAVGVITSPSTRELRNWPAYDRSLARSGAWRSRIDVFHREADSFWPAVSAMRRAIDEFAPDVLHTHAGTPTAAALMARAASARPDIPLVAHFYSWGLGRPSWMDEMDLWAFAQADAAICSARSYREVLRAGGVARRRLRLIPWGLSIDATGRPQRSTRRIVGTLGRIERRKGQLALVRAFARLRSRWPEARLEIIGPVAEPRYAAQLRAAITRLKLGDAVRLTGHVADPDRYLRRWTAYVSLSSDEGQGLAVLEAMAAGVPVVALHAAGIEDYLVDGRTGWLLPRRSAAMVAARLDRLFRDPAHASRLSSHAATMVRRRFSWERTLEQINRTYRSVLEKSVDQHG